MIKKIIGLFIFLGILGGGYFAYRTFFPTAPVPQFLVQLEHKVAGSEERIPPRMLLNDNSESDLRAVILGEDSESITVFTKKTGDELRIDTLVLSDNGSDSIVITLGLDGKPSKLEAGDEVLTYSNYTDTSVDITVIRPDGSSETITDPISPLATIGTTFPFVRSAHAVSPSEQVVQSTIKASAKSEGMFDFITRNAGFALKVTACGVGAGVGLTASTGSAGLLAPATALILLKVGCVGVVQDMLEDHFDVNPCHIADVTDCTAKVLDFINEEFTVVDGPRISGIVTFSGTGEPVEGAKIFITGTTIRTARSGKYVGDITPIKRSMVTRTTKNGHYYLYPLEPGTYTLTATTRDKEMTSTHTVELTNKLIEIKSDSGHSVLPSRLYDLKKKLRLPFVANYKGDELKNFHHVRFDFTLGTPGKFDGNWRGEGETTSSTASEEDSCDGESTFTWTITKGEILGTIIAGEREVKFKGFVDDEGTVEGGIGPSFIRPVSFKGSIDGLIGGGTWQAWGECSGKWKVIRDIYLQ